MSKPNNLFTDNLYEKNTLIFINDTLKYETK